MTIHNSTKFRLPSKCILRNSAVDFQIATRKACGLALAKLGHANDRVIVLKGDTKNSTFSATLLQIQTSLFKHFHLASITKHPLTKHNTLTLPLKKKENKDFPGVPMMKNPPANARDMRSISGPGRFHMPRGN